jgi:predicted HTH domain antitoxin
VLSSRAKEQICHTTELRQKKLKTEIDISLILQGVHSVVSLSTAATLLRKSASVETSVTAAVLGDIINGTYV